jgi:hypothetical protein
MVVGIEGHTEKSLINKYVDNMPTRDSRFLRKAYKAISPNLEIKQEFTCASCGHEQELEVPFGADFFWPER